MMEKKKNNNEENINDKIERLLKKTSLYTKIKVPLEMQHLNLKLEFTEEQDRPMTDEEYRQAHEWAHDMALYLTEAVLQWQENKGPVYPDKIKKQLDEQKKNNKKENN